MTCTPPRQAEHVNFLMGEGDDLFRAAYHGNYDRLALVKRRYDADTCPPMHPAQTPSRTAQLGHQFGRERHRSPTARDLGISDSRSPREGRTSAALESPRSGPAKR